MLVDEKDIRILLALVKDARTPVSNLADEIGLSVSSTTQRIAKLEGKKIIRGYKLALNHKAFPYNEFDIYYTLTNVSEFTIKHAMKYLSESPYTTQVLSTMGHSDIRITVLAKDMMHLNEILMKVEQHFAANILRREILAVTRKYKSKAENFLSALFKQNISTPKRALTEVYKDTIAKLDTTDVQLLEKLAQDPRASYASLAASVKLTAEAVSSRVKNLERKNIITGYTALLNGPLLGYQWAVLLLNTRQLNETDAQTMREYTLSHVNVSSMVQTIGTYSMSITLFGESLEQIHKTELDFRSRFGEHVIDSSLLFILENEKYPELAGGILKQTN